MNTTTFEDIRHRPNVIHLKWRFGMLYGIVVGLSFSASTWGIDGYSLSQAHAFYPWLKFIIGAILCMIIGAIVGWLVARLEKGLFALLFYLGMSVVFSWLTIALPFQVGSANPVNGTCRVCNILSWQDHASACVLCDYADQRDNRR